MFRQFAVAAATLMLLSTAAHAQPCPYVDARTTLPRGSTDAERNSLPQLRLTQRVGLILQRNTRIRGGCYLEPTSQNRVYIARSRTRDGAWLIKLRVFHPTTGAREFEDAWLRSQHVGCTNCSGYRYSRRYRRRG